MAKRCSVVHWHVPELSLLLVGYRRVLRCLRHCCCVLPKRQTPRVALGETLWLCSLFFLLFVVKWSSVPGAMRHPRTGLCLRRGRGSCLGHCWQALSKRCPKPNPLGVQTPAAFWGGICSGFCALLWGSRQHGSFLAVGADLPLCMLILCAFWMQGLG